ncbi:MAG: lysophospholipid acyltransferase family protein [Candidatus Binatia bacterium]|nr:lysophospholipid acyltransferase family protein [Candidatus Binatia bacterium]
MNVGEIWTAIRQWTPFAIRTIGYGSVSCFIGPFTKEHSASLWAMRKWCVSSLGHLDIRLELSGVENVPVAGPFVYCSNHQSLVDILVLGAALPGDYKWAAKRSVLNIPFLGWHLRLAGHVPVDRGGGAKAADDVIERFAEVLRKGKPLLIFPEGTRSVDGELKDFKAGAFKAAIRGNAPIVPVALDGTFAMMSKGDFNAGNQDKVVRVRLGTPISLPAESDDAERVEKLRVQTQAVIGQLFESIRGDVG